MCRALSEFDEHYRSAPVWIKVQSTVRILKTLLTHLEGFFILLATIMFSLNLVLPSVFVLEVIVVEAFVIYGALKLNRRDLLAQTPTYFLMKFVDQYVWLKCLVNEVVLRKRELQWLRADRNSPWLRIPRGAKESELRMATTYARVRNPFHNPF